MSQMENESLREDVGELDENVQKSMDEEVTKNNGEEAEPTLTTQKRTGAKVTELSAAQEPQVQNILVFMLKSVNNFQLYLKVFTLSSKTKHLRGGEGGRGGYKNQLF